MPPSPVTPEDGLRQVRARRSHRPRSAVPSRSPAPRPPGRGVLHFSDPADDVPRSARPSAPRRERGTRDASQPCHPAEDGLRQVRAVRPDPPRRSHLARPRHRPRSPVVLGRPARREPGPHRPDGSRAQAAHVRRRREHGLQGGRGRLPRRQPARLRLHPSAHRGGPDPRRRDDPGAGAVPAGAAGADVRVPPGCAAGDRPLLQLDQPVAAAGRVRPRQAGHRRHRRQRRPPRPQAREDGAGHGDPLRVLARELHADRARVRRSRSAKR